MGRRTGILESGRVLYLPLGSIRPNPAQPRRVFDPAGLQELADSIREYGILQPLTVRRRENGYELIAGERRLRAAGMAGLTQAPCLVASVDEEASGMLALVAAVVSIVVKEWMFWYTRGTAKKINSGALMADAWHHRSDAMSSVGAFVGIFGARMGFPILDPLASVVICLLIVKASVDIFRDAIDKMVDRSCDEKTEKEMRETILKVDGVKRIDLLQTRLFGSKMYVDIEIAADGAQTLDAAHEIAEKVHHAIEETFTEVKHCMVHVNPI